MVANTGKVAGRFFQSGRLEFTKIAIISYIKNIKQKVLLQLLRVTVLCKPIVLMNLAATTSCNTSSMFGVGTSFKWFRIQFPIDGSTESVNYGQMVSIQTLPEENIASVDFANQILQLQIRLLDNLLMVMVNYHSLYSRCYWCQCRY